jgi:hypothetical protein
MDSTEGTTTTIISGFISINYFTTAVTSPASKLCFYQYAQGH